eukprot:2187124-Amphidinium_carterae.1
MYYTPPAATCSTKGLPSATCFHLKSRQLTTSRHVCWTSRAGLRWLEAQPTHGASQAEWTTEPLKDSEGSRQRGILLMTFKCLENVDTGVS